MKFKTNNIYQILIVVVFLFCSFILVFINFYKKDKLQDYFSENISSLDMAYHSSIDKYRLFSKYIFNESINNQLAVAIFEKGLNATTADEKKLYKGLLYKELYPLYQRLKEEGIRQFHFYSKDNKSYLRFHSPNKHSDDLSKDRETILLANSTNKIVSSFEIGKVMSGFRNIFPINFGGEHLGSVEISISTKTIIDSITNLNSTREYSIVLNKDVVYKKLFESQKFLYNDSLINSDFVIEDINSSLPDSPKELSNTAKKINQKLHNNKELKEAMKNGETYGAFVKIDDIYYDIALIPMLDVSSKVEGYLIGYQESKNIPFMLTLELYIYFLVIASMVIIISMLLIIQKKTKNLDSQSRWFKSITDSMGEGLYVMDSKAKINYINPTACQILGYTEKELLGKNAHNFFHSHSINNNIKAEDCPIFLGLMKEKSFVSQKEYFLSSKGENIPVAINSKLILHTKDDFEIVTSFSDISIQKKLEEKSNLLIKALESSINSIVITDKMANVQWANPAFEDLTGFKIDEIIGKNPRYFISSKKQSKEFYANMWKTILSKKPWKGEIINKKRDGSLYNEELIITPVLDEEGEIANFIAIKQDITEQKLIALEKEERDKLFFQQSKMAAMGEMLGNIAHQWRQPLSVISTAATGIKLQKDLNILNDKDLDYAMSSINNSAQYLSKTIDDFRSFFDPKNNKEKEFSLLEMIEKSLSIVSSQFVSKNIEIIKNIEDIKILSSENELIQVILNILNNAKDALNKIENSKKLIFISIYLKNEEIFIEIKDNAGGVDNDIVEKIFDPYFTTKHQSQGTGIGLYMSQNIIKNILNGHLKVSNDTFIYEGVEYIGAKFTISLKYEIKKEL